MNYPEIHLISFDILRDKKIDKKFLNFLYPYELITHFCKKKLTHRVSRY